MPISTSTSDFDITLAAVAAGAEIRYRRLTCDDGHSLLLNSYRQPAPSTLHEEGRRTDRQSVLILAYTEDMNNLQADEELHLNMLRQLAADLPTFEDGRIDYTTSDAAPVVNCMVCHGGRILLLQRSDLVGDYQQKWSGVDGYIDTLSPLRHTVLTELEEELGLTERDIADIKIARPYRSPDAQARKTWIVYAVLVELKELCRITLDWEHTQYRWIYPDEIANFDLLPGQERVLKRALALRVA